MAKLWLISERKKPDATVCYHKLESALDEPKEFTLVAEHKVAFYPADQDKDSTVTCTNIATTFTKAHWEEASKKPCYHLDGSMVRQGLDARETVGTSFRISDHSTRTSIEMLETPPNDSRE